MSGPKLSFHAPLGRRNFLASVGSGMGLLALRAIADEQTSNPLAPRNPAFKPKAKRLIHLFMNGGPSQIDSFDPKPLLAKYAGKPIPGPKLLTERPTGSGFPSPFKFLPRGQSGLPISELFPNVAQCADMLCVVRSMQTDTPNHEPALMLMNCGDQRQIRPSLGSWLVHGLGTECANLPGFISLCPGGLPVQEGQNWQNAFLPAACQGTHLDTLADSPSQWIENLSNQAVSPKTQQAQLALARKLQALNTANLPPDARLEGRLGSMELAFHMQWEASDALDLARENQSTRNLYGDTIQGRQMLLARRLIERGTRVVQVWTGAGQPWDSHDDLEANHRRLAKDCDQAIAALLVDLKRRGVLEDTLVRREIAYQVVGGTKFYDRAEVKDAVAYLTLLINGQDAVSFQRVANTPRRGLGQTSLSRVLTHAQTTGVSIWEAAVDPAAVPGLGKAAVKALGRFMETMEGLRKRHQQGDP